MNPAHSPAPSDEQFSSAAISDSASTEQQRIVVQQMLERLTLRSFPFGDSRDYGLIEGAEHLEAIRKELGRAAAFDFFSTGLAALFAIADEPCTPEALAELEKTATTLSPFAAQGFTDTLGALTRWHVTNGQTLPLRSVLESLCEIARNTGEASWIVFKNTIPRIVSLKPMSAPLTLACVTQVCRNSKGSAAKLLEYGLNDLFGRSSLIGSVDNTLEVLKSISELCHPYELPVMRSLGDFLTHTREPIALDVCQGLLTALSDTYKVAGKEAQSLIRNSICLALESLKQPVSIRMFESVLELKRACDVDGDVPLHLLIGASRSETTDSLSPVSARLERIKGLLPKAPTEQVVRALIRGYQAGRAAELEQVLQSCVDTFDCERTADSLPFLALSVARFPDDQLQTLMSELSNLKATAREVLLTNDPIQTSPAAYIALRLISGADDTRNPWRLDKADFDTRWNDFKGPLLDSVLTTPPGITFEFSATTKLNDIQLRKGAVLDTDLIYSFERKFRFPTNEQKQVIMSALAKTCNIDPGDTSFDPLSALVASKSEPELFRRASKMILPLLGNLTGFALPPLLSGKQPEDSMFNYLSSLETLLDEHVPSLLRERRLEQESIAVFKDTTPLRRVRYELDKFTMSGERRNFTCQLVGGKNMRGMFIDQIGETCVTTKYGSQLDHPLFEPVVLACEELMEAIGCVYLLRGSVDGIPALIVAGVEPRLLWVQAIKPTQFLRELYSTLEEIARYNHLPGGVYINVGPPSGDKPWTDDGRMAQYERVRACMIPPEGEVLALSSDEQIDFPKGFSTPISHVVKV